MSERLTPQGEYTFVPEDWDGHIQDDDCPWKDGDDDNLYEFIRDRSLAGKVTDPVLKRFLSSPDRTVLKKFKKGDVFRIDRFSHEAVVRFTTEIYVLGKPVDRDGPYNRQDFWGVVCALPTGRVVLMRYFVEFSSGADVFPGFFLRGDKIVPEVPIHQRYRSGYSNPDALIRHKDLALYSAGKVAPELERERRGFRLPNLGTIFRRPSPQPA